ncbi:hypothetical protein IHE45_19G136600 [Dioscorea alata]|uniref:Uncharacterized protein n=1 Tax=Dioscorea alata TaxID=55571 RepID=A0ACB7U1V3_DIOAL|nr:hypothetical protein IHE45_19G136600 [Dioscorea alata]
MASLFFMEMVRSAPRTARAPFSAVAPSRLVLNTRRNDRATLDTIHEEDAFDSNQNHLKQSSSSSPSSSSSSSSPSSSSSSSSSYLSQRFGEHYSFSTYNTAMM